jgi:pimeloyl-ACP methyl ester carboxylesterase
MPIRSVEIEADGAVLRGELCRRGSDWVVLVHEIGSDLDACRPLFANWDDEGPSVLAVDLRGHGGSDGEPDPATVAVDVAAAVGFARSQGAAHVSLIAAGSSAEGAIAATRQAPVEALVLLSPESAAPAASRDGTALSSTLCAKLIFYGSASERAEEVSGALLKATVGPASRVAFPTAEQGTALLRGEWADHVLDRTRLYLDEQRYLAADPLRRR